MAANHPVHGGNRISGRGRGHPGPYFPGGPGTRCQNGPVGLDLLPSGRCRPDDAGAAFFLNFTTWQGLWQINGGILVLYGIILFKATADIPFANPSHSLKLKALGMDIFNTVTSPGPLLLALIFVTYALQWLAVMGFLPTLLLEKYGFSRAMASWLTAGMVSLNILGNLAGGKLLKAGYKRWMLIGLASSVMGACAMAIYAPHTNFTLNYAGCLIFSLVGGLIPTSVIGAAPLYAPSKNLVSTTTGFAIQGGNRARSWAPRYWPGWYPPPAPGLPGPGSWAAWPWSVSC